MARLYVCGSIAERFEARLRKSIDPNGCWEIDGYHDKHGRGFIGERDSSGRYRMKLASRVAYVLKHGPIPSGRQVLHKCDNGGCCRDDHLYLGGYLENAEDCSSRGRRHGGSKVTRELVRTIRQQHAAGATQYSLAKVFGLSDTSIGSIVHRKSWTHV